MSGGRWNYQSHRIRDLAENLSASEIAEFLRAVAETEHIVDWAECGDTVRRREDGSGAERDLYDLWLGVFTRLYDG
jgi:hypothetical protein